MSLRIFVLFILVLNSITAAEDIKPSDLANKVTTHHGLKSWLKQKAVKAKVQVRFGEKTVINHTFSFEINGAKARMDSDDGTTVIFDGKEAWAHPATADTPKGRFHVLTWPWFIRAPFTLQQPWQQLGPVSTYTARPYTKALYSKQTFAAGTGDTPDDWYGLLVDQKTGELLGMNYIVTYGKDLEKAESSISQINYKDYQTINGCRISTRWILYRLNSKTLEREDKPKATGTVSQITFFTPEDDWFKPAKDAKLLPLPPSNQQAK